MGSRLHHVRGLRGGERGAALSSPMAVLSVGVVLAAGVALVLTGHHDGSAQATPAAASVAPTSTVTPTRGPVRKPAPAPKPKPKAKPVVHRGEVYVEVFNNSGIHGLAGSTAGRAQGAGWQVVGSDNWYGSIPASTVYYPARLKAAARLLGKDLGIARTQPLIAPMRGDRLTVILTTDYS